MGGIDVYGGRIISFFCAMALAASLVAQVTSRKPENLRQGVGHKRALRAFGAGDGLQQGSPWPKFQQSAQNWGQGIASGSNGEAVWETTVGDPVGQPVIDASGIIYATSTTALTAVNPDGTVKWTDPISCTTMPAIGIDGTLYLGSVISGKNCLAAINPDGSLQWLVTTNSIITCSPNIGAAGSVYFGTQAGDLTALHPDGSVEWSLNLKGEIDYSPALGPDGSLYVSVRGYGLIAIATRGVIQWSFSTSFPVSAPLVGPDGTVYFVVDYQLFALNVDGTQKWVSNLKAYTSPIFGPNGNLYVVGLEYNDVTQENVSTILQLDQAGSLKAKKRDAAISGSLPTLRISADGTIYLDSQASSGFSRGTLLAYDDQLNLKWSAYGFHSCAIGSDGTLYGYYFSKLAAVGSNHAAAQVSEFTLDPQMVSGGGQSTAKIKLDRTATLEGALIGVTYGTYTSGPDLVRVLPGESTVSFTVTSTRVPIDSDEILTARANLGGASVSATLRVTAPTITSFKVTPSTVEGGAISTGTLTLDSAAAANTIIKISSTSSKITGPSQVTFAAGSLTTVFTITTGGVDSQEADVISASLGSHSVDATLTLTPAKLNGIAVLPASVVGGSQTTVTGTITLRGKAGTGGVSVALSSSNSVIASVPTSVVVPEGKTSVTFDVSTTSVVSDQKVTFQATYLGVSKTVDITVIPLALSSITLSPDSLYGGLNAQGTVTLNSKVSSSVTVNLSSDKSEAALPPTVTILAGAASATFTVSTVPVPNTVVAQIACELNGLVKKNSLTIKMQELTDLKLNPSFLTGGLSVTGKVTLTGIAPSGGILVALANSNPTAATIPPTVLVQEGQSTATFSFNSLVVSVTQTAKITASLGAVTKTVTLTVNPFGISLFSVNPTTIVGGTKSIGTITLNSPVGDLGLTVSLQSDVAECTVPATVFIVKGHNTAVFDAVSSQVNSKKTVTLTAKIPGSQKTATLVLDPLQVSGITLSPISVVGGSATQVVGTININGPAPAGGVTVSIASSNSSAASVPTSLIIPAGNSSGTVAISTNIVASNQTTNISASLGGVTKLATLTVTPFTISLFTVNPTVIFGGSKAVGTISLNTPIGEQGLTVALQTDSADCTLPSTVFIAKGSTSATFDIGSSAVASRKTVTLTAQIPGSQRTTPLVLDTVQVSSFTLSPITVVGGSDQSVTGTITLNAPATTGGVTIAITNSNSTAATVSSTLMIPAGQSSGTIGISTSVVATTQTAVFSASLHGASKTSTLTVNPFTIIELSLKPTSVIGGISSSGTLIVSNLTGEKGLVVNLTSDTAECTVPSTIIVPKGKKEATFTVTTSIVDTSKSAKITAQIPGSQKTVSLFLESFKISSFSLSPTSLIGGSNEKIVGSFALNGPAGPNGLSVKVVSTDPTLVSPPSTVSVPAGSTVGSFTINAAPVTTAHFVTLTLSINGSSKAQTLVVYPLTVTSVVLNPKTVIVPGQCLGTVVVSRTIGYPAGVSVNLSSNNPYVTVPASVTIPPGVKSTTFNVVPKVLPDNESALITASIGASQSVGTVTFLPLGLSTLTLQANGVRGGQSVMGTVTLNAPATAGGLTVYLSGTGPVKLPSTLIIAEGAVSATFIITTSVVSSQTVSQIYAKCGVVSRTVPLTIWTPDLLSIVISPPSIAGGNISTGTLTISDPAPAGSILVGMRTDSTAATVDKEIRVAPGATSAVFPIYTSAVPSTVKVNIIGFLNIARSAPLMLTPVQILSVSVAPRSVFGGASAVGSVLLNAPAPIGGTVVALASSDFSVTTPTSVQVVAGQTSATFAVSTLPVSKDTIATLSATYNGIKVTADLTVISPVLKSLTLSPTSVVGRNPSIGTVTLSSPAPIGGIVVALASDLGYAVVPKSILVPVGQTSATFQVKTNPIAKQMVATITGVLGETHFAVLTIRR